MIRPVQTVEMIRPVQSVEKIRPLQSASAGEVVLPTLMVSEVRRVEYLRQVESVCQASSIEQVLSVGQIQPAPPGATGEPLQAVLLVELVAPVASSHPDASSARIASCAPPDCD